MSVKKKRDIKYVPERLQDLAFELLANRKGLVPLPEIDLDISGLEQAVKCLPKKNRESLEIFFGLVPGAKSNYRIFLKKSMSSANSNDIAIRDLSIRTYNSLFELYEFNYIKLYDKNLPHLVNKILCKIDSSGITLSNDDIIKYFLVYIILISGGPRFSSFDGDLNELNSEEEASATFDHYAILSDRWNKILQYLEDDSIRIAPIVEYVHLLPLKQRVRVLQMVRIHIPPSMRDYIEGPPPKTFADIRKFKEELFPYGPWNTLQRIIFAENEVVFTAMAERFQFPNWLNLSTYKVIGETELVLSTGTKHVNEYLLGNGLSFTDFDEVIFLYLSRRLIED